MNLPGPGNNLMNPIVRDHVLAREDRETLAKIQWPTMKRLAKQEKMAGRKKIMLL